MDQIIEKFRNNTQNTDANFSLREMGEWSALKIVN